MGRMYEAGIAEAVGEGYIDREQGLRLHLSANFYPPHPSYVIDSTVEGFKKYWAGEISLDELREACYLRDTAGLYKYFHCFLREEDGGLMED